MWMSSSASSNSKPWAPIRSSTRSRPAIDLLELRLVEDADPLQRPRVRLRLVEVVGRQPPVELESSG